MAKSFKPASEQEGEISVSIIQFKMKGSDASLQKGLDSLKSAFAQAGFVAPMVHESRQLRAPAPRQLNGDAQDTEPEVLEEVMPEEAEDAVETAPRAPKKPSTPKKAPNFKIIKGLDFNDVTPTLADFIAVKKPESTLDRYLCIAYWFKHHKNIENLTTEHFFSAYMTYQWPQPSNAAVPISDLRHQKRQLMVAAGPGLSTITNAGEARVVQMGKVAKA